MLDEKHICCLFRALNRHFSIFLACFRVTTLLFLSLFEPVCIVLPFFGNNLTDPLLILAMSKGSALCANPLDWFHFAALQIKVVCKVVG